MRKLVTPLLVAVLLLPLAVTAVAQRSMRWTPVFDLAMIELRVRDASAGRFPLLGLVGRIGTAEHVGSHPGPLAFYLLAPVYRLLGATSWALEASALVLHAVAIVVAVLIGRRRAGLPGAVAVGALLALVVQGYGMATLAEAWNPHLPVLWFVVCLVATWSVVDGDRPMLPVAVFAAAVAAQTHVPYLAVTTALLAVGAAACLLVDRSTWRGGLRWLGASVVLGLVLWSPPLVEELTHDPGNLTILVDHFATPPEAPIGFREGGTLLLRRLDLWHVVVDTPREPGDFIGVFQRHPPVAGRGAVVAAAWLASAAAAVVVLRRRRPAVVALHVVVGAGLGAGWFALARIFGAPLYYLMLWTWSVGVLAGVAVAWTAVELALLARPAARRRVGLGLVAAGLVLVVGLSGRLLTQPRPHPLGFARVGQQLGRLVPATAAGLAEDGGRERRWLVTWSDTAHIGAQGYGLVNELERRHFDVGVIEYHGVNFLSHRVRPASEATGRLHLATGPGVDRWAEVPGARQIASDDPRSAADRRRYDDLRAQLVSEFRAAGHEDLVAKLDEDLWSTAADPRVDGLQGLRIGEMRDLGVPAAVFIVPVDAEE